MRFWWPNQTNGRPRPAAAAVVLDGELVGLRPAELQHLGGLLDGQERRKVVQHGARPFRSVQQWNGSMRATVSTEVKDCCIEVLGSQPWSGRKQATKPPAHEVARPCTRSSRTTSARPARSRAGRRRRRASALEPYLGYRLNQAGVLGDREDVRQRPPAEPRRGRGGRVLALLRPADRVVLPAAARLRRSRDRAGRRAGDRSSDLPAADLAALVVGTPRRLRRRSVTGSPSCSRPTPTRHGARCRSRSRAARATAGRSRSTFVVGRCSRRLWRGSPARRMR